MDFLFVESNFLLCLEACTFFLFFSFTESPHLSPQLASPWRSGDHGFPRSPCLSLMAIFAPSCVHLCYGLYWN